MWPTMVHENCHRSPSEVLEFELQKIVGTLNILKGDSLMGTLNAAFNMVCQPISLGIPALIIHHSFTLSLQAQNLPFQQILPTLEFFYLPDCLRDNGTGPSRSSVYF